MKIPKPAPQFKDDTERLEQECPDCGCGAAGEVTETKPVFFICGECDFAWHTQIRTKR